MTPAAAREGLLTFARINELRERPVEGDFDVAHLREIHRRIFQDLPHHAPGDFRPDAPGHVKQRSLEGERLRYDVPYALRPEVDAQLGPVLAELRGGEALRCLDDFAFAERMARLYGDLDHLHPFREGNSRTLRSFTEQLARQSGRSLDWHTTNLDVAARDNLYMARDFAVIQRAWPGIAIKEPGDIADRDEMAALMTLGRIQWAERLSEVIRRSAERTPGAASALLTVDSDRLRNDLDRLYPAARHAALAAEQRTELAARRDPTRAPHHREAAERLRWIDQTARPDALAERADGQAVTYIHEPGVSALDRVTAIERGIRAAEKSRTFLTNSHAANAVDPELRAAQSHVMAAHAQAVLWAGRNAARVETLIGEVKAGIAARIARGDTIEAVRVRSTDTEVPEAIADRGKSR